MNALSRAGTLAALVFAATAGAAAQFEFDGMLGSLSDVVRIDFHLDADTTGVGLWTDSFQRGLNFDPVISVSSALTGRLIEANDDNPFVGRGQTLYDAGLRFDWLAAGDYVLTLAAYSSAPAGTPPGSFYSLNLARVDAASISAVPEPPAWALLGLGLAGGLFSRRRNPAGSLSSPA